MSLARRLPLLLMLLGATLLLAAACGGDDDDDGDDQPVAADQADDDAGDDDAGDDADGGAMADDDADDEADGDAMAEDDAADGAPSPFAALDGLSCTGDWLNLTFGSTGPIVVSIDVNDAGDGGTITIDIGGFVFGGEGGVVEAPFTIDGDRLRIDANLGLLGQASIEISADGSFTGEFKAPPALFNDNSGVTITDFVFDGGSISFGVDIDFGTGDSAKSEVTMVCAGA